MNLGLKARNRQLLEDSRHCWDSEGSSGPFLQRENISDGVGVGVGVGVSVPESLSASRGAPHAQGGAVHSSPGLLMYMWMGFLLLSDCRNSSCAMTRLATPSSICKWRKAGWGMFSHGRQGEGQGSRCGVAADESGNQDGGQSPSKTGWEEFRIQEMFGSQEGVVSGLWAQVGERDWSPGMGGDHRSGRDQEGRRGCEGVRREWRRVLGTRRGAQKLMCPGRGVSG